MGKLEIIRERKRVAEQVFSHIKAENFKKPKWAGGGWDTDRTNAESYINEFPELKQTILEYAKFIKGKGEKFIYADFGGRAFFDSNLEIADKNYTFDLRGDYENNGYKGGDDVGLQNVEHVKGDLTSSFEFDRFVDLLKARGEKLNFGTLETLGGLSTISPEFIALFKLKLDGDQAEEVRKIMIRMLFRRLKKISEVFQQGGFFLLGYNSFINDYIIMHMETFKKTFLRAGFEVVKLKTDTKEKILLRKL